jgi:5-formyltetrahydrofolate cyclo-ligase
MALHLEPLVAAARGPVALFCPTPTEASPLGLLDSLGSIDRFAHGPIRFAWPRVATSPDSPIPALTFHLAALSDLVPGAFRLLEPPARLPLVPASDLALIVVPGLAFDHALNRLGQGGGFYDATLARTSATRVGLAYACQRIPSLPTAPHDLPMDVLVTELAVYQRT